MNRPVSAQDVPRRDDVVAAVVDATPVPRVLLVLPGVLAALVLVELVFALVVTL